MPAERKPKYRKNRHDRGHACFACVSPFFLRISLLLKPIVGKKSLQCLFSALDAVEDRSEVEFRQIHHAPDA